MFNWKKKWIPAICREEGRDFRKLKGSTFVCSQYLADRCYTPASMEVASSWKSGQSCVVFSGITGKSPHSALSVFAKLKKSPWSWLIKRTSIFFVVVICFVYNLKLQTLCTLFSPWGWFICHKNTVNETNDELYCYFILLKGKKSKSHIYRYSDGTAVMSSFWLQ